MVPRCSSRITRVPLYSLSVIDLSFRVRGYHPLWPDFPDCSTNSPQLTPTGLVPFRSPLLRESRLISFPPVTEMFQFTGFARYTYGFSAPYSRSCGFPHSEIAGSQVVCHLTDAYRRLPRLSSPSTAKASTICACSLDHITPRSLRGYGNMQAGSHICERDILKRNRQKRSIA
jgi:hypothetical protein